MIWQFENWKVLSLLGFCYDYNISIEKFYFILMLLFFYLLSRISSCDSDRIHYRI